MLAVELSRKLEEATGLAVAATIAYDYPSVTKLQEYFDKSVTHEPEALQVANFPSQRSVVFISGMACRFGGCWNAADLDSTFVGGVDCVTLVPSSRWKWEENFAPDES